jgi:hypothetical protein
MQLLKSSNEVPDPWVNTLSKIVLLFAYMKCCRKSSKHQISKNLDSSKLGKDLENLIFIPVI